MKSALSPSRSGGWMLLLCAVVLGGLVAARQVSAQSRAKFQQRSSQTATKTVEEPQRERVESRERSNRTPTDDTAASLDGGLSVNPALLQSVRDNTLGLEPDDRHAYFLMLWLCRELGAEKIAQFAEAFRAERQSQNPQLARQSPAEFSTFADLLQNPEACQGRPVQLQGRLRRLVKLEPGENELGVRHAYEGWLYDEQSQNNPTVVIFTRKPKELTVGGDLAEDVRCAGYFLKLYGYEAEDTTRKAPLVIAGELEWNPQPAVASTFAVAPWLYAAMTLLVVGVVWMFWRIHHGQHARRALPELCTMQFASPE